MGWGHLVVASDGRIEAAHALCFANRLAARAALRCTLITVVPPGGEVSPALAPQRPVVLNGHPAIEIGRFAEASGADVVVLGRPARPTAVDGSNAGTAEALVRRCRIPCLLVPPGQQSLDRLVVALDGTDRGFVVLDVATELATLVGGRLEPVTVEFLSDGPNDRVPRARTLRVVEELGHRWHASATSPKLRVRVGDPAAELKRELGQDGADLLVIGARLGAGGGPPQGSTGVGRALLHQAPCAVLTVPL